MNIFIFHLKNAQLFIIVGNIPFVLLKRSIINNNLKIKVCISLVNNIVKSFQKSRHEKG